MPQYSETRTPYEFLVRWNDEGALVGAQVQFLEKTFKDGVCIAANVTPAAPVAVLNGSEGFDLPTLVGQIVVDQQKRVDELSNLASALMAENEALKKAAKEQAPTVQ